MKEAITLSLNQLGSKQMTLCSGIANPKELSIMTEVFDDHCRNHNIVGEIARKDAAELVLRFFNGGATTVEELKARLDVSRAA